MPHIAAQLLENTPSRRRALAEVALVLLTLYLPANFTVLGRAVLLAVTGALFLAGLLLLSPWSDWRSGRRGRAVGGVLLLALSLLASTASEWFGESLAAPPRLGVMQRSVSVGGDGEPERKVVELTRVVPGLPADGRLEVGDRILSVEGEPLSASAPERDLLQRVQAAGGRKSTDLRLGIERQGEPREVTVPLGPARNSALFKSGTMLWLGVRALGIILLVALLLWRDGQGPAQLGLVREGLGRELLLALPITVGVYAVHLTVSVPLTVIAARLNLHGAETAARRELAEGLIGTGLSLPAFAALMVVVTGFEELAFRGFLIPRLRVLLGHWYAAVLVSAALFGLGHVYEGTLAIFQIGALGAYLGFVFIFRFRLLSLVLAHAAFNTVNYALMLWLQQSGLLDKLGR